MLWLLLLAGVVLHYLLWQIWEPRLQEIGEKLVTVVTGRPLNQTRWIDDEGIPMQLYRKHGLQYNPLFVALQAKKDFPLSADSVSLHRFIHCTDWLLKNAEEKDDLFWLPYKFDLPEMGLRAPWHSSLAQAYAMTCFVQRASLGNPEKWLPAALGTLGTLDPDSGMGIRLNADQIWFPEYPGTSKNFVLNGHMSVLLDLHFCAQTPGMEKAKDLFEQGYNALLDKLPAFDYHGLSYYSLDGTITSRDYHRQHIALLQKLIAVRSAPVLTRYLNKWKTGDRLPVILQLFFNPRPKRIIAFTGSLLLMVGVALFINSIIH
jgi:hypothetical protein